MLCAIILSGGAKKGDALCILKCFKNAGLYFGEKGKEIPKVTRVAFF